MNLLKVLYAIRYPLSANKGQSLVEVLVALMIVSLVALGLTKATISSVRNTGFSKDQSQTAVLAQKKISEIVNQKNQGPSAFFSSLPSPTEETQAPFCLKTSVTAASLPTDTPNYSQAQMAKISVDVYWGEKDSGTANCNGKVYGNTKHFETNVTN